MAKPEGEPLIHFDRLSSFPKDARKVLFIRSEVNGELTRRRGTTGPVDDLVIEETRQDLQQVGSKVIHPIAFILPNIALQIIAKL